MGFLIGIFKKIIKSIIYSGIVLAIILLIPNLPPYSKFTSIEIEPTQPRVGALAPNGILNKVVQLYKGKLLGPEQFQVYNGEVYTGLATGEIVKISASGHVTFVTKIGQPCTGLVQEHICGRALGFAIDEKNKLLYVADAYHGIWKVNLVTDKKQLLVSPQVPIDGKLPKTFNALALDKNGDLYWTHSSTDYHLKDGVMAVFTDPTGRLLHYNSAKNESKVLLDELWFANGVAISSDNQFVVVAETNRYRLVKYYLNGPKKGTSEVFSAGLPGIPDNIRLLPDGSGILVSLYSSFDEEHPMLTKSMAAAPQARKLLARILRLIEIQFEFLNNQFPNHIFEQIVYYLGSFASVASLSPGQSGLVQLDWNGNVVASYYNMDGSVLHISDAVVFNGKLLLGSPHLQDFVGAVPVPPQLQKAFANVKPTEKAHKKPIEKVNPKLEKEIPEVKEKVPPKQSPNKVVEQNEQKAKEIKSQAKQNSVPKESERKQKLAAKESVTKPNEIRKEQEAKPKVVAKESQAKPKVAEIKPETKPKVATKEPEVKHKVVEKENVKKPSVVTKTPETQPKDSDVKSKNTPETKPKVAPKEQETKPKVATQKSKPTAEKTKPDKQTETKIKEAEVKPKIQTKEPEEKSSKPETVIKESQNKDSKKVESESKTKKNENAQNVKSKPIPVEETIPSDTAKPNKGTLKVIKKSGPQEIPNPNL